LKVDFTTADGFTVLVIAFPAGALGFTGALAAANGEGVGGVRTWLAAALACPKAKVRTAKAANGQPSLFFMVLLSLTNVPSFASPSAPSYPLDSGDRLIVNRFV
jgi:hypothetical protein